MFEAGVHHVSVNVDDVEVCAHFYIEKLGFARLPRPDLRVGGAWLQMGPQQLHLIAGAPPVVRGPHFALKVDDIESVIAELRGRGVEVTEPTRLGSVGIQAFLDDPAGNRIELNQPR